MDCRRLRISLEIGSHFLYFKKGKFSTVRIAHQVSQRADRHVVPHSICVDPAHSQFPFSKAAAVHLFHASFRASPPCLSCLPFPLISRSLCGRRGQRKLFYRFQFAHTWLGHRKPPLWHGGTWVDPEMMMLSPWGWAQYPHLAFNKPLQCQKKFCRAPVEGYQCLSHVCGCPFTSRRRRVT